MLGGLTTLLRRGKVRVPPPAVPSTSPLSPLSYVEQHYFPRDCPAQEVERGAEWCGEDRATDALDAGIEAESTIVCEDDLRKTMIRRYCSSTIGGMEMPHQVRSAAHGREVCPGCDNAHEGA